MEAQQPSSGVKELSQDRGRTLLCAFQKAGRWRTNGRNDEQISDLLKEAPSSHLAPALPCVETQRVLIELEV